MTAATPTVLNRDHLRSRAAFAHVSSVNRDQAAAYGRLALKLPFLIRTAGLAQALAFIDLKASDARLPLVDHLAGTLGEVIDGRRWTAADLLRKSRETDDPAAYLQLTRETLKLATWYKRLSTSVLGVEEGDDG